MSLSTYQLELLAALLHDSIVVMRACPQAVPLAMITMSKSIHGFSFLSYMGMGLCLELLYK